MVTSDVATLTAVNTRSIGSLNNVYPIKLINKDPGASNHVIKFSRYVDVI